SREKKKPLVILLHSKLGESSAITTILTRNNGIIKGRLGNYYTRRDKGSIQPGNIVTIKWRARLSSQLGNITINDILKNNSHIIYQPLKLNLLNCLLSLLCNNLLENDPCFDIFQASHKLLEILADNNFTDKQTLLANYILFEVKLLNELGFGMQINKCIICGRPDKLIYISPKTGNAACLEHGYDYRDKLLTLPQFIVNNQFGNDILNDNNITPQDIEQGLRLTSFFLEKNLYRPMDKTLPSNREKMLKTSAE
ncbi:MAG: DNA repair protein RecO, partial [Pseudomonadota bacterium]